MEPRIVNTLLLVFFLLRGYSFNESATETIVIDAKVPINDGEIRRENVSREIRTRKPLDIEIETSWDNGTIDHLRNKKLPLSKIVQIFRYCLPNESHQDQIENHFLRINLIRKSNTEYIEKIRETFTKETSLLQAKNKTAATGKENVFIEECRIHLDPSCDAAENYKNLYYPKWFPQPTTIDDYADNMDYTYDNEIIRKVGSGSYEEVNFRVNETTFAIYIIVEGDFSNISIQIPIETKRKSTTGSTTLSMAQREKAKGVEVVALNAPPGGWRVKLTGEGASKYTVYVGTRNFPSKENSDDRRNYDLLDADVTTMLQDSETVFEENGTTTWRNFDNIEIFDDVQQDNRRIFTYDDSLEDSEIRNKRNKAELRMKSSIQSEKKDEIQSRLINDPSDKIIFEKDDVQVNTSVSRMMDNQELAEEFARIGDNDKEEKRSIIVELNENSNLFVRPGTIHRIIFDVTNNHYQTIGCYFKIRSLPLTVYNVQPLYTWIFAGRTVNVFVDVEVPRRTSQDVINTLTLFVQSSDIIEKSVYLYVEGTTANIVDDTKPSIEYTFNNNCAGKLNKDRCAKSRWSVDIRVQDSGSGLKSVKASPNELYPRTEFISGTKTPVTFYYSATCCTTQAKITATDLRNNVNTYTVDVTEWDNLSEAEIAAITVGALLILLLLILIIILIVYCVRKRKSHDLPYTQRYGSRPPARAERTSF